MAGNASMEVRASQHGKFICRAECLIRQVHCACPGGQRIPLRVDPEEVARGLPRDQPGDRGEAARSAAVGRRHEPRLRVRACALHGLLLQHFIGWIHWQLNQATEGPSSTGLGQSCIDGCLISNT